MISAILATISFLIILEGLIIAFLNKDVKNFMKELVKKKNAEKTIRTIGLWEILIGMIMLLIAIFIRRM